MSLHVNCMPPSSDYPRCRNWRGISWRDFARMSRAEKKRDVTKAMRCEASFRSSCIEIFCFSRIASARRDFFLTKSANWEEKMCEIIIKNQLKIIMSVERTSHRDSSRRETLRSAIIDEYLYQSEDFGFFCASMTNPTQRTSKIVLGKVTDRFSWQQQKKAQWKNRKKCDERRFLWSSCCARTTGGS